MNRKLVVFVPTEALDAVRDAVFAAGAGRIGGYERRKPGRNIGIRIDAGDFDRGPRGHGGA